MRSSRFPNQKEFAKALLKHQSWISQRENPDYGRLTLITLLEVASALEVALEVDFGSFSQILDRATPLTPDWFEVKSYKDDAGLTKRKSMRAESTSTFSSISLQPGRNSVVPFPVESPKAADLYSPSDVQFEREVGSEWMNYK